MGAHPINEMFPVTRAQALREHARLRASPVPLERPVLILGGWRAPRLTALGLERTLKPLTSGRDEDFLTVTYPLAGSAASAWARAERALLERFSEGGPGLGRPIDVVGISMGGLVAKLAAMDPERRRALGFGFCGERRLHVHRLFTLATPHRGARLARLVRFDAATRLMRPGSPLLRALDDSPALERLVPYTLLGDWWVGSGGTAPEGLVPIWLPPQTLAERALGHFLINRNPAIVADVARRLRGEEPLGRAGAPPPSD
ncbi:MAG: hypothetical protein FJ255_03280 [Phycisphaerae bacterium]|nr:hypothetical protein [Phycisphaerae bacterium]